MYVLPFFWPGLFPKGHGIFGHGANTDMKSVMYFDLITPNDGHQDRLQNAQIRLMRPKKGPHSILTIGAWHEPQPDLCMSASVGPKHLPLPVPTPAPEWRGIPLGGCAG